MTHYIVVSEEVGEVIPILDYGQGPIEYFRCVAVVDAPNPSKAKAMALKTKEFNAWLEECSGDNPFVGLKVEKGLCPHGICQCEICCGNDEPTCPECLIEFNKDFNEL